MADYNRSINIYLNEQEVSAQLEKLAASADSLKAKMEKAASPEEFNKLSADLDKVNGKMNTLGKQLTGEVGASLRQMESNISKLRNELKNTATGTDEFNKKMKQLGAAEAEMKKVQKEMNGVREAVANAGKGSGVFDLFKGKIQDLVSMIPGVGTALTALTGPIGILIGVLVGLGSLLMQNAEVADKMSFAWAAFKKVIQTLADDFTNLIKNGFGKLSEAINNPKQALTDFGKAIIDNVINRFKALGVIMEAIVTRDFKKLSDGVIQLAAGVENGTDKVAAFGKHLGEAAQSGWSAAEALDALAKQQADLEAKIQRTNIEIAKQTTIMRDSTRSDAERLAAAQKVVELETINSNRRLQQINLEIAAYKEKYKGIVLNGEQEAELTNLQIKLDAEKAAKEDAVRKAKNEAAALSTEIAKKQQAEVAKNATNVIESVGQTAIKSNEAVVDSFKKVEEGVIQGQKTFKDYTDSALQSVRDFMDQQGAIVQAGANFVQQIFGVVSDSMAIQADKDLSRARKADQEERKRLERLLAHKKINEKQYRSAIEKMDADLDEKQREQRKKAFKADKAMKIVMAVINTALAVVNALATMPYPASIVMAALAGAAGAAQIGVIAAQPMPQFAKGGYLDGPSHSAGGMAVIGHGGRKVAEVEGGEFIVNKASTRKHFNLLNAINAEGNGGKYASFNAGGVLSAVKYATGGIFNAQSEQGMMRAQLDLLQNIHDSLQRPVGAVVDYGEVKRRGDDLDRARARASFSKS